MKFLHATKLLVIIILAPLFNYAFIREVAKMLEYQQPAHQTYGFVRMSFIRTMQRSESHFKFCPIYLVRKLVEWVRLVHHIYRSLNREEILLVGLIIKISKSLYVKIINLADLSKYYLK